MCRANCVCIKMNFTPSRKLAVTGKQELTPYDHDLQLYREIPDININLDEFEEWAIERLKGKNKINVLVYILNIYKI